MGSTLFPPAASGGLQEKQQVFTSDGTWTKPTGVKSVKVTLVGAGGNAGGIGAQGYTNGGGGGGVLKDIVVDVTSVTSVPVWVGGTGSNRGAAFGSFAVAGAGSPPTSNTTGGWSGASIQYGALENPASHQISASSMRGCGVYNGQPFRRPVGGDGKGFLIGSINVSDGYLYNGHPFNGTSTWWGKTVTGISGNSLNFFSEAAYGAGIFVLMPNSNAPANVYYTSSTGQLGTWSAQTFPVNFSSFTTGGVQLQYANGIFMVAGSTSTNFIVYTSTTGLTGSWTKVYDAAHGGINAINNVYGASVMRYSGGRWIIWYYSGGTNSAVYSTNNGASWTTVSFPSQVSSGFNEIAYINGNWVIVDMGATSFKYSNNLTSWTTSSSGISGAIVSAIQGRNGVYIVSTGAALYYSTNGTSFTDINSSGTNASSNTRICGSNIDGYIVTANASNTANSPMFLDGAFGMAAGGVQGGASAGSIKEVMSSAGVGVYSGIDGYGVGSSKDGYGYQGFGAGAASNASANGAGGLCIVRWFE